MPSSSSGEENARKSHKVTFSSDANGKANEKSKKVLNKQKSLDTGIDKQNMDIGSTGKKHTLAKIIMSPEIEGGSVVGVKDEKTGEDVYSEVEP
jgi:hypothetical protein